jgi:hypothetical protein
MRSLKDGWVFANGAGKPQSIASRCAENKAVLKHAGVAKRVTIHGRGRTATDLLRHAAVDPVAAKAIIGHTTERMHDHYPTSARTKLAASARASSHSCPRSAQREEVIDQAVDPPTSRFRRACHDTRNSRKLLILS